MLAGLKESPNPLVPDEMLFDRITSCVSAEGKRPREGADLGYGVSSSHGGLLLRDSLTGSQAPLSTHLLPPFYHQVFALA